jgi:hypothetical protein
VGESGWLVNRKVGENWVCWVGENRLGGRVVGYEGGREKFGELSWLGDG